MLYIKITDEGMHSHDWGGDPIYWMEINAGGHAERNSPQQPRKTPLAAIRSRVLFHDSSHGTQRGLSAALSPKIARTRPRTEITSAGEKARLGKTRKLRGLMKKTNASGVSAAEV